MVNVQTEILISRPRSEVAEYAADPDNAPRWYMNIHKSQRLTTGPLAPGSKVAFTAKFLGRRAVHGPDDPAGNPEGPAEAQVRPRSRAVSRPLTMKSPER